VAIIDHGTLLALGTPEELKAGIDADTVVTMRAEGDLEELGRALVAALDAVSRPHVADGALQVHVSGNDRLVPRLVSTADGAGFALLDLSVSEPNLETVFIHLTGRELRES
jgi:ABC-2 type transport system ATP-binding protein